MTDNTPRWIGAVGFILLMIFSVTTVAGEMLVALVTLVPLFVLVYFESRFQREASSP